jgi:hypothetical protein
MRRKRMYRRTAKSKAHKQQSWNQGQYTINRQQADRLVERFAELALLDETDARVRLRNFLTYGLIGLLQRWRWDDVIDARIMSWLRLIKLGRLDGTVDWARLYQQVEQYARLLDIPIPAPQIIRALFNSIPKPRYWHAGKGFAVDGIRQRATLILFGRPRFHAVWLVITFPLVLKLSPGKPQRYYMILIIDEGSELPMGGWLSADPPISREVSLALYQAIWHPGLIEWPLHGIPEVIRISKDLVSDGIEDLQRASEYLMAQLDIVDKISLEGRAKIRQMRDGLKKTAAKLLKPHDELATIPIGVALQALLQWLIPQYFPNHRVADVPLFIRRCNVAMAGHDTPAAGWLLPTTGTVDLVTSGIVLSHGERYRSRVLTAAPGQQLMRREFPVFYPKLNTDDLDMGIFVEQGLNLHYLQPE